MSKRNNLQDPFLNILRKEGIPVSVFLVSGTKLQGQIESFDQFVVLLKNTVSQMVYKHAISTIVPSRSVRLPEIDMSDENLQTLTWFSNGYYNLSKRTETGTYKYVDLRYPMINPEDENSSVFNFTISKKNNEWDILPFQGKAPTKKDLAVFVARILGI